MIVTFRSPSGQTEQVTVRPGTCKDVAIDNGLCSLPLDAFDIYRGTEDVGNRPMIEFAGCTLVIVERRRHGPAAAHGAAGAPTVVDTTRRRPEAGPGVAAHGARPPGAGWRDVGRAVGILALLGFCAIAVVLSVMHQHARQELERAEYEKRQIAAFRLVATGAWVGMVGHWPARLTIRGEGPAAGTLVYAGTGKKTELELSADKAEGPLGVRLRGLKATGTADPTRGEMRGRIDEGGAQQDWYLFKCLRPDAQISGTWKGHWERNTEGLIILNPFAASRIEFTLSFQQDDERIAGSVAYDGRKGESAVDGWVCGRRLVFGYAYADGVRNECFGTLSGDGRSFQGFWAQQGGFGSWRMTRANEAQPVAEPQPVQQDAPQAADTAPAADLSGRWEAGPARDPQPMQQDAPRAADAATAADLSGEWIGRYVDGRSVSFAMRLVQNDRRLSGFVVEERTGRRAGLIGKVDGDSIVFSKTYEDETGAIRYAGTLASGATVASGYWSAGLNSGTWEITRRVAPGRADDSRVDLSGRWVGSYVSGRRRIPFTVTMNHVGGILSGTMVDEDTGRHAVIAGKTTGHTLLFEKKYGTSATSIEYSGTIASGAQEVTGSWSLGDDEGSWEMSRTGPDRPR